MRRSLGFALLFGGIGVAALAQDTPSTAPVPEETAPPSAVDDAGSEGLADQLDSPDVGNPDAGVEPPVAEPLEEPIEEPVPEFDPVPPVADPAAPLPGAELPPEGLPGADLPPARPAEPLPTLEELRSAPDARLDDPLPDEDLPPADPRRRPIERQPLPFDPDLTQPLPPDPDLVGPRRRFPPSPVDPAYGPPAPPRVQPEIAIDEVVRNPIRIYEARLLVLMGHWPGCEDAIGVLARRFPTDARVHYLRYFQLSRTGERDAAIESLRQAVALERLYPVTDYNRFMEPLQGPDRFYAERVRRAAAELAAVDGLVEPDPDELLPAEEEPEAAAPPDDAEVPSPPEQTEPAPEEADESVPNA